MRTGKVRAHAPKVPVVRSALTTAGKWRRLRPSPQYELLRAVASVLGGEVVRLDGRLVRKVELRVANVHSNTTAMSTYLLLISLLVFGVAAFFAIKI